MTRSSFLAAAALALCAAPALAQASHSASHSQASASSSGSGFHWGPQIIYDFNDDNLGGGLRGEYSLQKLLGSNRLDGMAEVNWFPGTVDVFDIAYNVAYRFQAQSLRPYAGGGLSLFIASGGGNTDTNLKLNAVGGLQFKRMGKIIPVIQLRYVFVQGDALFLSGGILF